MPCGYSRPLQSNILRLMLHSLIIRNYATVAALDIEFKPGMSAITGETGAGKSIILGALGLTLGDRADRTVIGGGGDRAEISAEFDTRSITEAGQWLESHDLSRPEQPGLCILRRIIHSDERSKAYINGNLVTLANLKELGEMLLDIHSQHEHQSLLRRATHLRLLDDFGVSKEASAAMHTCWQAWHENHRQLSRLRQRGKDDSAEAELLGFQLQELDEVALADGEVARLEAEGKRLDHADDLISSVQGALNLAAGEDEGNLQSLLHQAQTLLRGGAVHDERIAAILGLLENAGVQLDEAVAELRGFSDGFEADPARLEQINARLGRIHALARKHRVQPDELGRLTADLRARLDAIEHGDERLTELERQDERLRQAYGEAAAEVGAARHQAAGCLAAQVNQSLAGLGMPNASLEVRLTPVKGGRDLAGGEPSASKEPSASEETSAKADLSAQGLESAEFLIITNPGQPPKPLIKIASGGELSRISLAIQVVTARTSQTPSLVFDEVDVGIGGGVAKVVGELLRRLGEKTQILCVTHQPQVAGQAHQHLVVSKTADERQAVTRIAELSAAEKVQEVARMLGGDDFSEESLAHAQQMVAGAPSG